MTTTTTEQVRIRACIIRLQARKGRLLQMQRATFLAGSTDRTWVVRNQIRDWFDAREQYLWTQYWKGSWHQAYGSKKSDGA